VPLAVEELSEINRATGCQAAYAERSGELIYLFLPERGRLESVTQLIVAAKVRNVIREGPEDLRHRLVGFLAGDRSTFGVGIIQEFDPVRRAFSVHTPVIDLSPLAGIHFGVARLTPEGRELPPVRD